MLLKQAEQGVAGLFPLLLLCQELQATKDTIPSPWQMGPSTVTTPFRPPFLLCLVIGVLVQFVALFHLASCLFSSKEAHSRDGMQEDEQAKAEEELDAAVQERRRLEQAEKWRLQQLKAGASSEENANFQVYIMLLTSLITPLWACVKLHYKSAHMHAGMSCSVTGEPCKAF